MSILKKKSAYKLANIYVGHLHVTYRGISAKKCPFDYVLYQMLIWEIKPDLVIEIGTNKGGSALYLADLLESNGKGEIHTIDLPENEEDMSIHVHPRIKIFKDGFINYETANIPDNSRILIIEDGSHQYKDTLAALNKFAPFISRGSYFIVEDGIINELGREKEFYGGPQKAIKEFLKENKQFIIDKQWCNFFGPNATFNVNGYLKRIS